jgi:ABC-type glutathione transport system ATPase component
VEATLRHLRVRTAISLVVVTHDIDQARRLADYVVRIESGRVIAQGPASELLAEPLEPQPQTGGASSAAAAPPRITAEDAT